MTHILDAPVRYWRCPSCPTVDRTEQGGVFSRMHSCPALGGITLPLQEVADPDTAPRARHQLSHREDYAGASNPVTAIVTERPDGSNDCTVLAETARGFGNAYT